MMLQVYAVARRGWRTRADGIAGEPLRYVPVGGVEAVVGHMATTPRASLRNLRRFGEVMQRLWRTSPALVPARFGTTVSGEAELERILSARHDELRRRLALVRHRAQMTSRLPLPEQDRPVASPRRRVTSGTEYLKERAAAALRARSVPQFDPVRRAVARWVRAERVEKQGGVATIYHLVPCSAVGRYSRAVERAARSAGMHLIVSGPWPAYAFTDLDEPVEALGPGTRRSGGR